MNWTGILAYRANHRDITSVINATEIPVTHFSVNGGAKRIIELASADDISFSLELSAAKNYKNISLFLPPARKFEWLDLCEVAFHDLPLAISFSTFANNGKANTHTFNLLCENAKITELPSKVSDPVAGATVLAVRMSLPAPKILHGFYQGGEFVEEAE